MLEAGAQYLKSFSFDYLCVALVFCVNGIITGSGHTAFASISNILSSVGFRIPMALLFGIVLDGGMRGLGLAAPIASLATTVLVLIFYFIGNSDFWIRGKRSPADRTYVRSTGEWT